MFFEDDILDGIRQQNLAAARSLRRRNRRKIRKKRQVVLDRDKQCLECEETEVTELTLDHIWPRSQNGCHCLENLQLLCCKCNEKKASRFDVRDGVVRGHPRDQCPLDSAVAAL